MRVFCEWRDQRNSKEDSCYCPDDLLDDPVPEKLNYWLCRFISEVRRQDGNPYPPRTINQILAGLQRHILEVSPNTPKLLDKSISIYRDLHRTCDAVYRQLHSDGIGMNVQHSEPFTIEEEGMMWKSGVLSVSNPKSLQRAIFYYVGKHFCVRGGEEQRSLKPSQFVRNSKPDSYTYIEHCSKIDLVVQPN